LFHIVAPVLLAEPALVAGDFPIREVLIVDFREFGMAGFLEVGAYAVVRNAVADQATDLVAKSFGQAGDFAVAAMIGMLAVGGVRGFGFGQGLMVVFVVHKFTGSGSSGGRRCEKNTDIYRHLATFTDMTPTLEVTVAASG
jgi:hypothetical protein